MTLAYSVAGAALSLTAMIDRKRNACGIHPDRFDTRAPYQLVKPLVLAAVDIFKSPADNEPVLSDKRHYVRHGAYCGEVRVLLEYEILVLLKCAEQFQDNSRAAKLLERGINFTLNVTPLFPETD